MSVCYASRARDLGGTEQSRRRCTGPAFVRVSIFLTLRGHLTLVVTSRGLPHGARVLGCSVCPWAYKYGPSFRLKQSWLCLQIVPYLPAERGNGREKFEENRVVVVIRPSEGRLWWPKQVLPFQQLVLEGNL